MQVSFNVRMKSSIAPKVVQFDIVCMTSTVRLSLDAYAISMASMFAVAIVSHHHMKQSSSIMCSRFIWQDTNRDLP